MSTPTETRNDDGTRPPRVGTVVWGLITVIVGILLLTAELTNIALDPGLVFMGLLIGAGLALVVGGILSMTRRNR